MPHIDSVVIRRVTLLLSFACLQPKPAFLTCTHLSYNPSYPTVICCKHPEAYVMNPGGFHKTLRVLQPGCYLHF
ncbi:hypothetical protein DFH28DRAFT_997859 [Melampsora americana]|nr:hypothetical protein DFH28DRAFT_1006772 [Melampsora americana]KAH9808352.1 hypothetical protein DFH28DRAFT_997859 [Melampsora americana]